jgi:hypothetical protein
MMTNALATKSGFKRITLPFPVPAATLPVAAAADGYKLPKLSTKFLFAGKALFTVDNGRGDHFTFKVKLVRAREYRGVSYPEQFFILVRIGAAYDYIGVVNRETGTIRCTAKSVYLPGSKPYDVAAWTCGVIVKGKQVPTRYEIRPSEKCGRCARTLTDPASIERGIGPECWKFVGGE